MKVNHNFSAIVTGSDNSTILQTDVDGEAMLVMVTNIKDPYGLDWILVLVIPRSEFFSNIDRALELSVIITVVLLTVNLVLRVVVFVLSSCLQHTEKTDVIPMKLGVLNS